MAKMELLTQEQANGMLANKTVKINFMGNFDFTNKVMQEQAHIYKDAVNAGKAGSWIKARAITLMCDKANYACDKDFSSQKEVCTFLDISQATATQSIKAVYLVGKIPELQALTVKTVYNLYRYLSDKTGNTDKITQFLTLCGQTLDADAETYEQALPNAIEYLKAYTDSLAELLIRCFKDHNTLFIEDKDEQDEQDGQDEQDELVKPNISDFIMSVVAWNNTHDEQDEKISWNDIAQVAYGLGLVKADKRNIVTAVVKVDSHK